MNFDQKQLMVDMKRVLESSDLQSEPYINNFRKYLGEIAKQNGDQSDFLVQITNALGVQMRNDVLFRLKTVQSNCPVLELSNMTIFKDIDDVMNMLRQLPSEWSVVQIVSGFSPSHLAGPNQKNKAMHIARFACGELVSRCPPYVATVDPTGEDNITEPVLNIWKTRRQAYNDWSNRKLRNEFNNTDTNLSSYFNEVEKHWLAQWKCLLTGRLEDSALETETLAAVQDIIQDFLHKQNYVKEVKKEAADMLYLLALSSHLMKNKDMMKVVRHALGPAGAAVSNSDVFRIIEALKSLNLRRECAVKRASKNPVILILDSDFELTPWEMFCNLAGQPVVRVLSLHMLYALYTHHRQHIVRGYRILQVDNTFCLINPGEDLKNTEKNMTSFLANNLPWVETEVGRAPEPQTLINRIQDCRVYLYCGHGSGCQYVTSSKLRKTCVDGIVFLYGCSSNLPQNMGGRTPYHNDTYTYLLNGSPCVVGCLYDILSNDADAVCIETMSQVLPTITQHDAEKAVNDVKEENVLKALHKGKGAAKFLWTQSSIVTRGLPCRMHLSKQYKQAIEQKVSKA